MQMALWLEHRIGVGFFQFLVAKIIAVRSFIMVGIREQPIRAVLNPYLFLEAQIRSHL